MPYHKHPHPDFPELPEDTKIVRVINKTKALDLALNDLLYIPRPHQFDDNFEGRLYTRERNRIRAMEAAGGQPEIAEPIINMSDSLTSQVAVSCWRHYVDGDPILWDKYGAESEKVAIFSTIERLKRNINPKRNFRIAKVQYVDSVNHRFVGNSPDIRIFQKDKSFEWEKEIRLVILEYQGGFLPSNINRIEGIQECINFLDLISEIEINTQNGRISPDIFCSHFCAG